MPLIGGIILYRGISESSLLPIVLGIGCIWVWFTGIYKEEKIEKVKICLRLVRWLLFGIGLDMTFGDSTWWGILLTAGTVLSRLVTFEDSEDDKKAKAGGDGDDKTDEENEENDENIVSPPDAPIWVKLFTATDDERVRETCSNCIKDAWEKLKKIPGTELKRTPMLEEMASQLKNCASGATEIESIEVHPYYLACMKAEVVTRQLIRRAVLHDPKKGAGRDYVKFVNSKTDGIWEVEVNGSVRDNTRESDEFLATRKCGKCSGEKVVSCPSCAEKGKPSKWDCPDCKGKANIFHKCEECNDTGETVCLNCGGRGSFTCSQCNGKGYERKWKSGIGNVNEPCSVCGHTATPGRVVCRNCGGRGRAVCESCEGTLKAKCKKCGSKGVIYCGECKGKGKVKCKKCDGSGVDALMCKVVENGVVRMLTRGWAGKDVPEDVIPRDTYYWWYDQFGECAEGITEIMSAESKEGEYDIHLLDKASEEFRTKCESLFEEFRVKKEIKNNLTERQKVAKQSFGIQKVDGLAKVTLKHSSGTESTETPGTRYVCWINLATATIMKIEASMFGKTVSEVSTQDILVQKPEGAGLEAMAKIGSPHAMAAMAKAKKDNRFLLQLACMMGYACGHGSGDDKFLDGHDIVTNICNPTECGGMSYRELACHLPGMMQHVREWEDAQRLLDAHPQLYKHLKLNYMTNLEGAINLAKRFPGLLYALNLRTSINDKANAGRIIRMLKKHRKVLRRYSAEYLATALGYAEREPYFNDLAAVVDTSAFGNEEWMTLVLLLDFDKAKLKRLGFDCKFAGFSADELVNVTVCSMKSYGDNVDDLIEALDTSGFKEEHWAKMIKWVEGDVKKLKVLNFDRFKAGLAGEGYLKLVEELKKRKTPERFFADLIDWESIATAPIERLIKLDFICLAAEKRIKWSELREKLETVDWSKFTDEERVQFAIEQRSVSDIALRKDFKPNDLGPWCLSWALMIWPEKCKAFDPEKYDWARLGALSWSKVLWAKPEYAKYCDAKSIDWSKLDKEPAKFWAMAVAACPEEAIQYCKCWKEFPQDMWPQILERRPSLEKYLKNLL